MFVTGTEHSEWAPDQAEAKSRLMPTASVAVIPDTAYLIPLEAPTETVRIVRELWAASRLSQPGAERIEWAHV